MTYSCVGIKLDPASGPYITIEPKDLEVDIIDPPMFGARRFGNGETATFKGVSYMKRDHIKIRLYSDIGVHEVSGMDERPANDSVISALSTDAVNRQTSLGRSVQ